MYGMRPLRLTLFLAVLGGLLSGVGYLWAPLIGPSTHYVRFSMPALHWSVLPLRITAAGPPNRSALQPLPLRVKGSFLLHPRHPKPHQVSLHAATPIAVPAPPLKSPATAAQEPDSRPSIAPAATIPPPLPEPVVRPPTPTPGMPIPVPLAPHPVAPAAPPTPEPASPTPQPAAPIPPLAPPPTPVSPPAPPPSLTTISPPPAPPPAPPPDALPPKIFLGYADTYLPRGTGLPSIWNGKPGVIFVGCGVNPNEDGPAVRTVVRRKRGAGRRLV